MLLIILATILVAAIAFYQVVQGLFSALIMAFLCIVSLTISFNFHEPLAEVIRKYQPLCAEPAALLCLFVISLIVLRVLTDRYLGRNVVTGVWANRIGGGFLGLVTGMILVGVLTVAIQMLPFGPSILGYRPFADDLRSAQGIAPFYPDDFALGLAKVFSRGSLMTSTENTFQRTHDNLKLELFCARNDAGKGGRGDAAPGSMSLSGAYAPETYSGSWVETVPLNPLLEGEGINKVVVIRAVIDQSARDGDGWWRLPATHFRLVAADGNSYYPIGYLVKSGRGLECIAAPMEDGVPLLARLTVERDSKDARLSVDWVYRIPESEIPAEIIFRRSVRAPIRALDKRSPDPYGALDRASRR